MLVISPRIELDIHPAREVNVETVVDDAGLPHPLLGDHVRVAAEYQVDSGHFRRQARGRP